MLSQWTPGSVLHKRKNARINGCTKRIKKQNSRPFLPGLLYIRQYTEHVSHTRATSCEHYSVQLAAVCSLSLTVSRRAPWFIRCHSRLTNTILRLGSTCHDFTYSNVLWQMLLARSSYCRFWMTRRKAAVLSLHVEVVGDWARQVKRAEFRWIRRCWKCFIFLLSE